MKQATRSHAGGTLDWVAFREKESRQAQSQKWDV